MTSVNDKTKFKCIRHFKRDSPMKKSALVHMHTRETPVKPLTYKNIQPQQLSLKWWDVFDALRGTGVQQAKWTASVKPTTKQLNFLQQQRFAKTSEQIGHPNAHKLHMATRISPFKMERSRTFGSNQLTGRTSFEIERPQTHGTSRLVINITTSLIRNRPKLSAMSPYRDQTKLPILPRVASNCSARTPDIKFLNSGINLPRGSSHKRSKVEQLIPAAPVNLSAEQKSWIADWIQSTNNAIENNDEMEREQLPAICEH